MREHVHFGRYCFLYMNLSGNGGVNVTLLYSPMIHNN